MKDNQAKYPQLRFKGFTDLWEQRKLGGYIEVTKNKNKNMLLYPAFSISNIKGFVAQEEQFGKDNTYSKTDKSTNYIVEPGMFAYNPARINVGSIAYQNQHEPVLVSSLYEIFKVKSEIDDSFLMNWFKTSLFNNQVKRLEEGGVRQYFFIDKMQETKIGLPSISEQKNISKILKLINKNLDLQKRKYEELKLLKKALLQNMFANKSLYPKLRFKGFTDDWKQRKLGEVAITFSGGTPAVSDKKYYNGSIPFIKSGELGNKKTEQKITKLGLENSSAKMIKKGTLLYALYGATSGECAISSIDGAINQAILAILPQEDKIIFLLQWLNKNKEKILKKYLQGGQGNLSAAIIKKLEIPHTNNKEESQVSKIFKLIDSLLVLQQQKIEKLQQFKKFLLQNMFI